MVDIISDGQARRIAADWHGGQTTALYALSSSGATVPRRWPHVEATGCLTTWDAYEEVGCQYGAFRGEHPSELERDEPLDALLNEIRATHNQASRIEDRRNLIYLAHYVQHVGARGPVAGWSRVWDDTPVGGAS